MKRQTTKLAIALLRLPSGKYVFQRRDAKAPSNPNGLALFGGHVDGKESPELAVKRELAEETSIDVSKLKFEYLGKRYFEPDDLPPREVYYFRTDIKSAGFNVYEGVGAEVYGLEEALERDDINPRVKFIVKKILNNE